MGERFTSLLQKRKEKLREVLNLKRKSLSEEGRREKRFDNLKKK
jgi:hypothetical protein